MFKGYLSTTRIQTMFNRNILNKVGHRLFPGREQVSTGMKRVFRRETLPTKSIHEPIQQPRQQPDQIPHKKKQPRNEAYYRDKLAQQLGGEREVQTPNGRIDIVTSDTIIEVKHVKKWKNALGQIQAYGRFYPTHKKRIHLFGEKHSVNVVMVEKTCREHAVIVTWEDDSPQ